MKMTRANTNNTYEVDIPAARPLATIDPALESLSDLAARRDALRLMAKRANDEAGRIDEQIEKTVCGHLRALRALAAEVSEAPALRL
ncbi:MAG: hypothetical protein ACREF8_02700, partial [Chthoniobacterales bacterium]